MDLSFLQQTALFLLFLPASFLIGRCIVLRLMPKEKEGFQSYFASLMMGAGSISFLALLLTLLGFFSAITPILLAAIVLSILLQRPVGWNRDLRAFALVMGAAAALSVILSAIYPIRSIDAMYYHAELSRLIYSSHAFPDIVGSGIGLGISSNYPPLLPALNAFLVSWSPQFSDFIIRENFNLFFLLLPVPAYLIFRELFPSDRAAVALSVMWVALNLLIISNVQTPYPLFFILFSLSFHYWLGYLRSGKPGELAASSILFGLSMLCTYVALEFLPIFLIFWAARKPSQVKGIALFYLISFAIFAPWAARDFALSGDPLYPLLSTLAAKPGSGLYETSLYLKLDSTDYAKIPALAILLRLPFVLIAVALAALLFALAAFKRGPASSGGWAEFLPYAIWLAYPLPLIFVGAYYLRYALIFLIPAAYITVSSAKAGGERVFFGLAGLCSFLLVLTMLIILLNGPCILCGYGDVPQLSQGVPAYGFAYPAYWQFAGFAQNLSGKIAAYDMPTYYFSSPGQVVPMDEGYVYEGLSRIPDPGDEACFLRSLGADYVLLPSDPIPGNPFESLPIFQNKSARLQPLNTFGLGGQGTRNATLYSIVNCTNRYNPQ